MDWFEFCCGTPADMVSDLDNETETSIAPQVELQTMMIADENEEDFNLVKAAFKNSD